MKHSIKIRFLSIIHTNKKQKKKFSPINTSPHMITSGTINNPHSKRYTRSFKKRKMESLQQMLKMKFKVTDEGKIIFIKPKSEIKILGVYLDENVTWKRQVSEVRKKASNAIRNLHRINNIVPVKHRVQLYNALVDPHFSYCDVIWGGCGVVNAKRLQTTQNYAVKSILGKRKRDSATDALTQLKFLNLKQRRSVHEAVFSHKALNKKQPDSINRQYESLIPISNTRAASTKTLNLPRHKTAKYQHSLLYRSIKTPYHTP